MVYKSDYIHKCQLQGVSQENWRSLHLQHFSCPSSQGSKEYTKGNFLLKMLDNTGQRSP